MNALPNFIVLLSLQAFVFSIMAIGAYWCFRRTGKQTGAWQLFLSLAILAALWTTWLVPIPNQLPSAASYFSALHIPPSVQNEKRTGPVESELEQQFQSIESPIKSEPASVQTDYAIAEPAVTEISRNPLVGVANTFFTDLSSAPTSTSIPATLVPIEAQTAVWPQAVGTILFLIALFGFCRLAAAVFGLLSIERASTPIVDAKASQMFARIESKLKTRTSVAYLQNESLGSACTTGFRRPKIILPGDWRDWSDSQLQSVVAHELVHVANRDFLKHLIGQIAAAIHFYNPLVHWLLHRLRLEQELIADNHAASIVGDRHQYLTSLAELALASNSKSTGWLSPMFLPTRRMFMRRIEMLRSPKYKPFKLRPNRGHVLTNLFLVVLMMSFAVVANTIRMPEAEAVESSRTTIEEHKASKIETKTDSAEITRAVNNQDEIVVKRIVGLPGEIVKISDMQERENELQQNPTKSEEAILAYVPASSDFVLRMYPRKMLESSQLGMDDATLRDILANFKIGLERQPLDKINQIVIYSDFTFGPSKKFRNGAIVWQESMPPTFHGDQDLIREGAESAKTDPRRWAESFRPGLVSCTLANDGPRFLTMLGPAPQRFWFSLNDSEVQTRFNAELLFEGKDIDRNTHTWMNKLTKLHEELVSFLMKALKEKGNPDFETQLNVFTLTHLKMESDRVRLTGTLTQPLPEIIDAFKSDFQAEEKKQSDSVDLEHLATQAPRDELKTKPAFAEVEVASIPVNQIWSITKSPNSFIWNVKDDTGMLVRQFVDTNRNGSINLWRFFKNGVRVYEEQDTNQDKKADKAFVYPAKGAPSKLGIDIDFDGVIDRWINNATHSANEYWDPGTRKAIKIPVNNVVKHPVNAGVGGRIRKLLVKEGQTVRKGDLLAVVSNRGFTRGMINVDITPHPNAPTIDVRALVPGTIGKIQYREADIVFPNTPLCSISRKTKNNRRNLNNQLSDFVSDVNKSQTGNELFIFASSEGTVDKVFVKAGDRVQRGDALASQSNTALRLQIKKVKADINQANAQIKALYANGLQLEKAETASASEKLRAFDDLAAARRKREELQNRMSALDSRMKHSHYASPVRGIVIEIYTKPGAVLSPGEKMFRIQATNDVDPIQDAPMIDDNRRNPLLEMTPMIDDNRRNQFRQP